jgi:Tol biopolymer transport system component
MSETDGRRACSSEGTLYLERAVRKTLAALLVAVVAGTARSAHAQAAKPPKPLFGTEIATSDSLYLSEAVESPDGRWLLFSSAIRSGPSHLWLMPASGGPPRRLTDGAQDDAFPVWFPSGRRIAYVSGRVHGVVAVDFDPMGGRLVGTPRRVSLDDASWPDVSPDGNRIVYVDLRNRLRIVPSTGGPAVTILDYSGTGSLSMLLPKFSRDGRDVYVSARDSERRTARLVRVPATGGAAVVVLDGPSGGIPWNIVANPIRDRVFTYTWQTTTMLTLAGDTIVSMPALKSSIWPNFTHDGRLLKGTGLGYAVVRLFPTAGGKPIDVTSGKGYDEPVAWSADAKHIYSTTGDQTLTRSRPGLLVSSVDGQDRRFIAVAEVDTTLTGPRWRPDYISADARFWWITSRPRQAPFRLLRFDTQTRRTIEVTRAVSSMVAGPGGFAMAGEVYYIEQQAGGAGLELRAVRGEDAPRVVHKFATQQAPSQAAVHGDRVAFGLRVGDSTILYVARGGAVEKRLTSVGGGLEGLAWSPDGSMLAGILSPARASQSAQYNVFFVAVSDQGAVRRPLRFVSTDAAWDLCWLPDNRAVTVLEEQGTTEHTRALRIPVDVSQQPTSLTPNERNTFWDQYPSPDGRYIALPVQQFGGSTLWSLDVDSAAKAWREKKTQTSSHPKTQ